MAVVFLNSMLFPSMSYALTSGPKQSEFQGFEEVGTTDMVDLKTGDLTYGIPLISVPGPSGGFSMPLSYHSGAGLEAEASWVGLGWSLNPGAISRNVSQFPDDFHGHTLVNSVHDDGGSGYGINAFGFAQFSWDSEKGSGGSVGLGNVFRIGFGTSSGFTALGVNVNTANNTVDANPFKIGMTVLNLLTPTIDPSIAKDPGFSVGKANISGKTIQQAASMAFSILATSGSVSASIGDWKTENRNWFVYNDYEYWLDASRTDRMYGSLYLGDAQNAGNPLKTTLKQAPDLYSQDPTQSTPQNTDYFYDQNNPNEDVVSDMHFHVDGNYGQTIRPTSIAYDAYQVMGSGISGPITPYRHDVGSLSYAYDINGECFNAVPYTQNLGLNSSNKVNFQYKGELANHYEHHQSSQMGMAAQTYSPTSSSNFFNVNITDDVLYNNRTEANRADGSLTDNKLAKGRNIQWFSNSEIINGIAKSKGFISDVDRSSFPNHGIGGFMVTHSDGTTYHYTIPVYNTDYFTKSQKADANDYTSSSMDADYATTWLLTAITGADFVDRSSIGVVGELDESDWGYWVKLNFGRFSDEYDYRLPYIDGQLKVHQNGSSGGAYSKGIKETYYLNTISTKTHTALFIKDVREDSRGAYLSSTNPASSLLLKEVVLLHNNDYKHLTASAVNGGLGFSEASGNNLNVVETSTDDLNQVLDVYDIASDGTSQTTIRTYLDQNQLSRIKFNHDYSLCPSTTNSFSSATSPPSYAIGGSGGKLTLNSVEMLGENNNKLLPNYNFTYSSNNPSYDRHKWDGWGMYADDGTSTKSTHYTSATEDNWQLKQIDLPTGAVFDIEYERDDYYSISGDNSKITLEGSTFTSTNGSLTLLLLEDADLIYEPIKIGDNINLEAKVTTQGPPTGPNPVSDRTLNVSVTAISQQSITVSGISMGPNDLSMTIKNTRIDSHHKPGGNFRVSKLAISDEFNRTQETVYRYTVDGTSTGKSSGVVSQEPTFIRDEDNLPDYYNYYDYSSTGVIYEKVTIFNYYKSDTDFLSKTEYEFVTPHQDMMEWSTNGSDYTINGDPDRIAKAYDIKVDINTGAIGQLKSITNYNQHQEFLSSVEYEFADNKSSQPYGPIGTYTEGSILTDYYNDVSNSSNTIVYNHLLRTTKTYTPTIPQAVVFKDNYSEKRVENTAYDLITGAVLETEYYDAWGSKYRTQNVPAYTVAEYTGMGSKTVNSSNKNMMSQSAGQYLYSYNEDGTQDLVSASILTWNNDWDYRELSTSGNFSEIKEANYTNEVYRKHKSYAWKSELNNDGTYANFTEFDYDPIAGNSGWEKLSEVTLYDHYSRPLESEDLYGFKTSMKHDVSGNYSLIAAGNAAQSEIFFSGLELDPVNELLSDNLYYNSTDATFSSEQAHTGAQSLKLTGTQGMYANMDIIDHKDFVLSAWVHSSNWTNAKLKVELYSGGNGTPFNSEEDAGTAIMQLKAGDWYLISLDVDLSKYSAATRLVASVENSNTSNPIYIDDFKFTPLESSSSCTVHNPESFKVVATLDADHLAKVYEYDSNGILKVVKQEIGDTPSLSGGMKTVQEYFYNYGKNN